MNQYRRKMLCTAGSLGLAAMLFLSACRAAPTENILTPQNGSVSSAPVFSDALSAKTSSSSESCETAQKEAAKADDENTLYVFICGAVRRSGVYILPVGSRVTDAVKAAGGLLPDADETAVNQAALLTDGEQITVPHTGEQAAVRIAGQASSSAADDTAGKININTADAGALQQLSGIGASRAADIIAYREMHGAFQSIEEIMNVSGIKTALYEKIRDQICI